MLYLMIPMVRVMEKAPIDNHFRLVQGLWWKIRDITQAAHDGELGPGECVAAWIVPDACQDTDLPTCLKEVQGRKPDHLLIGTDSADVLLLDGDYVNEIKNLKELVGDVDA